MTTSDMQQTTMYIFGPLTACMEDLIILAKPYLMIQGKVGSEWEHGNGSVMKVYGRKAVVRLSMIDSVVFLKFNM